MAYTTINKSSLHQTAYLYTGDGNSPRSLTGVGFQPDLLWIKNRSGGTAYEHRIMDAVRGSNKVIHSSQNAGQNTEEYYTVGSFDSDGWTGRNGTGSNQAITGGNDNTFNFVAWNWKASGTAPTKTYRVVVVNDGGNKYRFRNSANTATFGSSAIALNLQEGGTYTFDVSDSTMNSHPFVLGTASGTDGSYSTGVTYKLDGDTKTYSQYTSGFSSATTRQLIITVAASAPTLYYNCSAHSGMGAAINTNSTFGSSNFDGTLHSTVSANTTSGFSIVKYTGVSGAQSFGHDLGAVPKMVFVKNLDSTGGSAEHWRVYHSSQGAGKYFRLNDNSAVITDTGPFSDTTPTSTIVSVGGDDGTTKNGEEHIAYCFAEIPGYSSIGSYTGNASTNGTFVYTGFKPSFILTKTTGTDNWRILDNKRKGYNPNNDLLQPSVSQNDSEQTWHDIVSNGFKLRTTDSGDNGSGVEYIYMAFGQTIVGTNNVPATAR
nr:hypothetical protein [uncultured Mediterranean phage uvMED]